MREHSSNILAHIFHSDEFNSFGVLVNNHLTSEDVVDATFYLRNDGLIVSAEGWYHPSGYLMGEVLYAPDPAGDRQLFGQPYRKVTLFPGTYEPVPYVQRAAILRRYDIGLDQTNRNPIFARYKQILPLEDFIAFFPTERNFNTAYDQSASSDEEFLRDIENLRELLDLPMSQIKLGLAGSPSLGQIRNYHDLDIVFIGSLDENRQIAERMRQLTRKDRHRRLFEGGKYWTIRFLNDRGRLMCCFFAYRDVYDIPLRDFEMTANAPDVEIEGTVFDDTHSMYTPTVLGLKEVVVKNWRGSASRVPVGEKITLIVYHTGSRGECFCGDHVLARGALVMVTSKGQSFQALCVIEREGLRNLTPPWSNYYQLPSFGSYLT